jgi:hypothetical protein
MTIPDAGTQVFLYSRSGTDCVGSGRVVNYAQEKYGSFKVAAKNEPRMVLNLMKIYSPTASLPCPSKGRTILRDHAIPDTILWPMRIVRLKKIEPVPNEEVDLAGLPIGEFTTPIPGIFDGTLSEEGITDLIHEYQEEVKDQEQEAPESENISSMSDTEIKSLVNEIGKEQGIEITPRIYHHSSNILDIMHLLLDMFHGMKRITDTVSKTHGAYKLFCSLLRDCFFLIYKEDSERVDECLRVHKGFSNSEITAFKRNYYSKYISYCRRVVPQPSEILSRLERMVEVLSDVEDFASGERLFKPLLFFKPHKTHKEQVLI